MKKLIVLGTGAIGAAAAAMGLFGTGVAAADDYAGQTYADASSAASDAGQTVVIAARVGSKLPDDECIVTRSQTAPFACAIDGDRTCDSEVQFYLNCNGESRDGHQPGCLRRQPGGPGSQGRRRGSRRRGEEAELAARRSSAPERVERQ